MNKQEAKTQREKAIRDLEAIEKRLAESEENNASNGAGMKPGEDDRVASLPRNSAGSTKDEATQSNRQDEILAANPERRCVAHRTNGDRCRKFAIAGSTVCRTHGGATRHVKSKARARIENSADKMARKLLELASDENVSESVRLAAIKDALDRAGLKPVTTVEIGPTPGFEEIFSDISSGTRDESRKARGYIDADSETASETYDLIDDPVIEPPTQPHTENQPHNGATAGSDPYSAADQGSEHGIIVDAEVMDIDSDRLASTEPERTPGSRETQRPNSENRSDRPTRHITGDDAMAEAARVRQPLAFGSLRALPPGR